jgi:hypothetical protein
MRLLQVCLVALTTVAHAGSPGEPPERLGTVSFAVSCTPAVQADFNRGVALLHDFWYAEARPIMVRTPLERRSATRKRLLPRPASAAK